jgi:hypothetical protein
MTEGKVLFAVAIVLLAVVSLTKNRDYFSPVKFYLLYSTFFYVGIFTSDVRWETLLVYVTLILSIMLAQCLESDKDPSFARKFMVPRSVYVSIWLMTIPGVIVKLAFISESGGIFEYLISLAFRVEEWRGRGYLVVWFHLIPVLNLIYFSYLLVDAEKSAVKKVAYVLHFVIFIAIGLLTGSRSYIAIPIVGMVVSYSYLMKKVSFPTIVAMVCVIAVTTTVLGTVRNLIGSEDPDKIVESVIASENIELEHFSYGIKPLELLFSTSPGNPHLGLTYLSLLTNVFPRTIFPDKLDTGAIVFTREYTGDQWGGLSHLSTGSVSEGVLNFGLELGVLFGVVLNLIFMCVGVLWYNRLKAKHNQSKSYSLAFPIDLIIYVYFVLLAARISFGEFTDVHHTFLLYCLAPCMIVRHFAERASRKVFRARGVSAIPVPLVG